MASTTLTGLLIVFPDDTTIVQAKALSDTPGDFGSASVVDYTINWSFSGTYVDDTYTLGIRIRSGATILAAANAGGGYVQVADRAADGTNSGWAISTFPYVNTAADKTLWDAAVLEGYQTYTQSGAGDSCNYTITTSSFDITYTTPSVHVDCTHAALALVPANLTLTTEVNIEANAPGNLQLSAYGPTIGVIQTIEAASAPLSLTLHTVTVGLGLDIFTTSPGLTLTSSPADVFAGNEIFAHITSLSLESHAPTIVVGNLTNVQATYATLALAPLVTITRDYPVTDIREPVLAAWADPELSARCIETAPGLDTYTHRTLRVVRQ